MVLYIFDSDRFGSSLLAAPCTWIRFAFYLNFLNERVPLLTALALSHPLAVLGAALGTIKNAFLLCHKEDLFSSCKIEKNKA
jgi:hypothetical protein